MYYDSSLDWSVVVSIHSKDAPQPVNMDIKLHSVFTLQEKKSKILKFMLLVIYIYIYIGFDCVLSTKCKLTCRNLGQVKSRFFKNNTHAQRPK